MALLKKVVLGLASLALWRVEAGPCKPSDATTTETSTTTTAQPTSTSTPSYTCQRRYSVAKRAEDAQDLRARIAPPQTCGTNGQLSDSAVILDASITSGELACAAHCAESSQCQSILFNPRTGNCQRLKNPVYSSTFAASSSDDLIYDLSCYQCTSGEVPP
ncbi:hypothetical protein AK830_g5312 [Neonectria ditissima]|uniref:Apple domain-containing protein n=1 Tax=Neonectria ditissima TaxID=78410 RepID=A0A0P7BL89_9HYPO|nr:hypothetical protein AK830_g5312 [Neonectria ditissima]